MRELIQTLAVTTLEATSMFAAGSSLSYLDVTRGLRRWRPLLAATAINCLAMPAVAWLLSIELATHDVALSQAMLITSASPGGGTGPLLALHARGDVPLSVVLTFALAIGSSLFTPFLLGKLDVTSTISGQALPTAELLGAIALYQVVPLVAGMALRSRAPAQAEFWGKLCGRGALLLLALLALGLLSELRAALHTTSARGWFSLVGLAIAALLFGHALMRSRSSSAAVALTTGVRNCALSLMIAARWGCRDTVVSVLQFAFVMYAVSLLYMLWSRRYETG